MSGEELDAWLAQISKQIKESKKTLNNIGKLRAQLGAEERAGREVTTRVWEGVIGQEAEVYEKLSKLLITIAAESTKLAETIRKTPV